ARAEPGAPGLDPLALPDPGAEAQVVRAGADGRVEDVRDVDAGQAPAEGDAEDPAERQTDQPDREAGRDHREAGVAGAAQRAGHDLAERLEWLRERDNLQGRRADRDDGRVVRERAHYLLAEEEQPRAHRAHPEG